MGLSAESWPPMILHCLICIHYQSFLSTCVGAYSAVVFEFKWRAIYSVSSLRAKLILAALDCMPKWVSPSVNPCRSFLVQTSPLPPSMHRKNYQAWKVLEVCQKPTHDQKSCWPRRELYCLHYSTYRARSLMDVHHPVALYLMQLHQHVRLIREANAKTLTIMNYWDMYWF